ncbi:hypothetical protein IV102_15435 [bacterium]|nr:hypothetical protein [bacterium]
MTNLLLNLPPEVGCHWFLPVIPRRCRGDGMTMDGKEKFTDYREFKGKYDAHGLSVFAPLSDKLVKSSKMAEYQGLDFTKETGWGDFITELNAKLIEGKKSQDGVVARPHNPEQTAA